MGLRQSEGRGGRGALRGPRRRPVRSGERAHDALWLLDLDNTLHDAMSVVFPRINVAMTEYLARELELEHEAANALRMQYWRRYGATLLGMIRHHGTDPHHFLRETHPFPDLRTIVRRDMRLAHALRRLPGRRIVVTNAPLHYASEVVRALGIRSHIESIVSIEAMSFAGRLQPKPSRPMLRRLVASLRVPASRCVLVEDSVVNLGGGAPRGAANGARHRHQPPFAPSIAPCARRPVSAHRRSSTIGRAPAAQGLAIRTITR
ncbi:MAG: hydrolase [Burkholderiaceae bacterium]|nr:hydrolase [Burkholderiaceae bacterium]